MEKLQNSDIEVRREAVLSKLDKAVDKASKALQSLSDPLVPDRIKNELVGTYFMKLLTSNLVEEVLSEDDALFFWDRCSEGDLKLKQVYARVVSVEIAWFVSIKVNVEKSGDPNIADKWTNKRNLLVKYFVEKMDGLLSVIKVHMDYLKKTSGSNISLNTVLRENIMEKYMSLLDKQTLFESCCLREELAFCNDITVKSMLSSYSRYEQICNDMHLLEYEMRNYLLEIGAVKPEMAEKYKKDIEEIIVDLKSKFLLN